MRQIILNRVCDRVIDVIAGAILPVAIYFVVANQLSSVSASSLPLVLSGVASAVVLAFYFAARRAPFAVFRTTWQQCRMAVVLPMYLIVIAFALCGYWRRYIICAGVPLFLLSISVSAMAMVRVHDVESASFSLERLADVLAHVRLSELQTGGFMHKDCVDSIELVVPAYPAIGKVSELLGVQEVAAMDVESIVSRLSVFPTTIGEAVTFSFAHRVALQRALFSDDADSQAIILAVLSSADSEVVGPDGAFASARLRGRTDYERRAIAHAEASLQSTFAIAEGLLAKRFLTFRFSQFAGKSAFRRTNSRDQQWHRAALSLAVATDLAHGHPDRTLRALNNELDLHVSRVIARLRSAEVGAEARGDHRAIVPSLSPAEREVLLRLIQAVGTATGVRLAPEVLVTLAQAHVLASLPYSISPRWVPGALATGDTQLQHRRVARAMFVAALQVGVTPEGMLVDADVSWCLSQVVVDHRTLGARDLSRSRLVDMLQGRTDD